MKDRHLTNGTEMCGTGMCGTMSTTTTTSTGSTGGHQGLLAHPQLIGTSIRFKRATSKLPEQRWEQQQEEEERQQEADWLIAITVLSFFQWNRASKVPSASRTSNLFQTGIEVVGEPVGELVVRELDSHL